MRRFPCDCSRCAWLADVEGAWPTRDAQRCDKRFRRMGRYYLDASIATFRTHFSPLWQLVLSPHDVPGGCVARRLASPERKPPLTTPY